MSALRKKAPFQAEVAVSILALVFIMATLNFAANRTLSRLTHDLREDHREKLTNTALRISAYLERPDSSLSLPEALDRIIPRENIGYAFVLDSNLTEVASSPASFSLLARQRIRDLLFGESVKASFVKNKYQFTYVRQSESEWEVFHCPLTNGGPWRILVLAKTTRTLATAERNARYLLILGVVIVGLISLGVLSLFRDVTLPFKRISARVAQVGGSSGDAEKAVDELVRKYKETITELRSQEVRLLELNERLAGRLGDIERFNSSLLGAITTGVVAIDNQGRLIGINAKARACLGLMDKPSRHSMDAVEYGGLFNEYPEVKTRVQRLLLEPEGDTTDFEYERVGADGAVCTFRVALIPLLEDDNSLHELMLLISDQTEVVRAQKRLEDSRQLATLGEMSAGLAHQLRNSISAAMGFSALAQRKAGQTGIQGARAPLDSLQKELQDEAALVDRFLSFARPLTLESETTVVSDFLKNSLAVYRANPATSPRVQLQIQSDGTAELDVLLLKQVVGNLVDNALRASESHNSPVDITAEVTPEQVVFIVSDYGQGISLAEQEKIFTPFYSTSPSGAGLGLPLARKIVELHGGTLDLASRPECGATFTIRIPRYQESAEPVARQTHKSLPNTNS